MNAQIPQLPPTLEQRRALAEYLENQRKAETSAAWDEYMREQMYRAERYAPTYEMEMDLPAPSAWQLIREEFAAAPLHQVIGFGVFFGFGLGVAAALVAGWVA